MHRTWLLSRAVSGSRRELRTQVSLENQDRELSRTAGKLLYGEFVAQVEGATQMREAEGAEGEWTRSGLRVESRGASKESDKGEDGNGA